jgi:hypothetical protein
LKAIFRGHQVAKFGFYDSHIVENNKNKKIPLVHTIFSCPNYCYRSNNEGGYCKCSESGDLVFKKFDHIKPTDPDVSVFSYYDQTIMFK